METVVQSFSSNLRRVITQAAELAASESKKTVEPAHLFYGLVNQAEISITTLSNLKRGLKKKMPSNGASSAYPVLSATSKKLLLDAATLAQSYRHTYVGTEHLLISLLECRSQKVQTLLDTLQLDTRQLNDHLRGIMNGSTKLMDVLDSILAGQKGAGAHEHADEHDEGCDHHHDLPNTQPSQKERRITALEYFSTLLTAPDVAGKLDPCIGRAQEIDRVTQVIARRTKNNPVLVGPPGVGKTAIVEGLAKRIASGDVPDFLKNKKIYSLDLTMLIAGTTFRGELEIRLRHLIDDVKADANAVLFIDEIHTLVGAGSSHGSLDAANIMKPALARGELRCIGATTFQEYKRFIEDDAALERRFQPIAIQPPSVQEAKKILTGMAPSYETHHGITISSEAIDAAVELSERYITEKFLPDKAIDVLDEASAKLRLAVRAHQEQKFLRAQDQIQTIAKQEFSGSESAATSMDAQIGLQERETKLQTLLSSLKETFEATQGVATGTLLASHIAEVVAQTTGIPIVRLLENQKEKLLALEEHLSKRVVGQDHAKQLVSHFIRRARAGLSRVGKPLASFLFLGPSGVGKTELARVLAEEVFGAGGIVKLDMSEFSESFTISRLIGSPAGYIGYKEGGRLTESIRQRPFSLVLFDEIEKAHPRVLQVLLQILDDGCLTDGAGKRVDFSNTIIVMTSNIGAKFFSQKGVIGFEESVKKAGEASKDAVIAELKNFLNPELINRIDQTVLFHMLESAHIGQIVKLHLQNLSQRLMHEGMRLAWSDSVHQFLTDAITKKGTGAREVRHYIESEIENKIAHAVLATSGEKRLRAIHLEKKRGTIEVVEKE
ncbi:ATP-dependent Clp protease ATP-binding subunit [Candidatus Uhrbacteria bacterium]|nr:ATP-dependent Clp protease ATP-binding subunit [Candidatus Uhrbacteria bacterium]